MGERTIDPDAPLFFAEEPPQETNLDPPAPWNILVVDDDEQVHATTRIVLGSMKLLGKPVKLHEARSAAEARSMVQVIPDLSVILLDVVMESEDAGLKLIEYIREACGMSEVRIILRTGQPGHAPELQVIENYDINDYKTKQELTHNRLITSLTAAVRSFQQIQTINHSRKGLEKIIQAASSLIEVHALESFAEGVLTQIASLLHLPLDGILCVTRNPGSDGPDGSCFVVAGAAGRFASHLSKPVCDLPDKGIATLIVKAVERKEHIYQDQQTVLYLKNGEQEAAIYLKTEAAINTWDRQLVEVFASNISVGYQNLTLIQKLEHTAYYDKLTGLPNRTQFLRILDQNHEVRNEHMIACLVDIDHFADINDGMGQEVGNLLLQAVADRLRQRLGTCLVARTGSDVFGIYGPDSQVRPEIIQEMFASPFAIGEDLIPVMVSLGFCRALEHGEPGAWLLKFATIALNRAKKNFRERHEYFKDEMEEQVRWRLETINRLRGSFRANALELWYQPQVDTTSGVCTGVEALLRWNDSKEGFISPAVFIPLAEYSGLIVEIGYWVVSEACSTLNFLAQHGYSKLSMAVNVSVPQFRSPDFVEKIEAITRSAGINPGSIEIEITESIVMDEPKIVIDSLERLRSHGFKVAIDDFGTGFSAMSYLQDLPLDKLKIDRTFVEKMSTPSGEAIVGTIMALCHTLHLKTVAEGVETAQQVEKLKHMACDTIQGFHFARPMPRQEFLAWLGTDRTVP